MKVDLTPRELLLVVEACQQQEVNLAFLCDDFIGLGLDTTDLQEKMKEYDAMNKRLFELLP